jgi:hypothetical protein
VRNPTGEGVAAVSSQATAKAAKHADNANAPEKGDDHETRVKEGTSKRNITRKKTDDRESGNFNSNHKKQGERQQCLLSELQTIKTMSAVFPIQRTKESVDIPSHHTHTILLSYFY